MSRMSVCQRINGTQLVFNGHQLSVDSDGIGSISPRNTTGLIHVCRDRTESLLMTTTFSDAVACFCMVFEHLYSASHNYEALQKCFSVRLPPISIWHIKTV